MKKVFFSCLLFIFVMTANAQDFSYGVLANLNSTSISLDGGEGSASDSEIGFGIGGFADFSFSDELHLQPELLYSFIKDLSIININAIAKYYVSDEFNVQAGPQIGILGGDAIQGFADILGEASKLSLQLAIGAGYEITDQIFVQARYGFQLNDSYTGDGDASLKFNNLTVGAGYRFN